MCNQLFWSPDDSSGREKIQKDWLTLRRPVLYYEHRAVTPTLFDIDGNKTAI